MIKVIYIDNPGDKKRIESALQVWLGEVRELLPQVPEDVEVVFDNQYLIDLTGTGGFALDENKIALAFSATFEDKETQFKNLRGSFYHECFHLVQGWTGGEAGGEIPAIEDALMEGAATVFERDRTQSSPPWADYSDIGNIDHVAEEVESLGVDYDWRKWKFYDSETNTRWILYKIGTYLVDKALANKALSIEDIATMDAVEILKTTK